VAPGDAEPSSTAVPEAISTTQPAWLTRIGTFASGLARWAGPMLGTGKVD
jgi:hypothetical protein